MATDQAPTGQQTDDESDRAAIRQAALDYMQGWYEADGERMRRALHPELAKRAIWHDPPTGERRFSHLNREHMEEKTAQGSGSDTPRDKRYYDVSTLDVCDNVASVKAVSYEYVDYLHLVRDDGRWTIMNVLWTFNPAKQ
jgi:hypothetical protein